MVLTGKLRLAWMLAGLLWLASAGARAQILTNDDAARAGQETLQGEVTTLSTIQRGVRLSVAECELAQLCDASVNPQEIDQIIDTINERIGALTARYTSTGETGLEAILIGYADVRDDYNEIRDKLYVLPQFVEQSADDLGMDAFFGTGGAVPPAILDLYEDADEELVDDPAAVAE